MQIGFSFRTVKSVKSYIVVTRTKRSGGDNEWTRSGGKTSEGRRWESRTSDRSWRFILSSFIQSSTVKRRVVDVTDKQSESHFGFRGVTGCPDYPDSEQGGEWSRGRRETERIRRDRCTGMCHGPHEDGVPEIRSTKDRDLVRRGSIKVTNQKKRSGISLQCNDLSDKDQGLRG